MLILAGLPTTATIVRIAWLCPTCKRFRPGWKTSTFFEKGYGLEMYDTDNPELEEFSGSACDDE
jgi:hypothetical protein